jgi:hypothetical protein
MFPFCSAAIGSQKNNKFSQWRQRLKTVHAVTVFESLNALTSTFWPWVKTSGLQEQNAYRNTKNKINIL